MNRFGFGIGLVCDDPAVYPGWVRRVEEAGFDLIGIGDTPLLYPDVYVMASICAQHTSRVRFGPRVTAPIGRHPLLTASAIATLDRMSGGRAVLGIGTGDSLAAAIGERLSTLAELEEYVCAVRALTAGQEVVYRGATLRLPWPSRAVPVYLAASGPRSLRLAGRIADGAVIGSGVLPEVVEASLAEVRAGAEEAGRDWRTLDLWWLAGCRVEQTRAEAEEAMLALTAALVNARFHAAPRERLLSAELAADVEALVAGYDYSGHVRHTGRSPNAALLASLPRLRAYASARWMVGGSPDDCLEQLEAAAQAGARQFWWTASFPDKMEFVDRFSRLVMPRLAHMAEP